jgi:hypothetical protein
MRIQRGRESFGAQVRHNDVPVRIIHLIGIAIQQSVTDKPFIQRDPESNVGLTCVIGANCICKPPVDILLRPDPLPVNSHRCEMFIRGQNPVVNDCRNVSSRDVPQTGYAVRNLSRTECRHSSSSQTCATPAKSEGRAGQRSAVPPIWRAIDSAETSDEGSPEGLHAAGKSHTSPDQSCEG